MVVRSMCVMVVATPRVQAFKLLALKLHPDKNRDDPDAGAHLHSTMVCSVTTAPPSASKFNRLQTAHEALNDKAAKAAVDALYKYVRHSVYIVVAYCITICL